ncbi:hypothetical protein, partial [Amycolatopsis sp. NPDC058986]
RRELPAGTGRSEATTSEASDGILGDGAGEDDIVIPSKVHDKDIGTEQRKKLPPEAPSRNEDGTTVFRVYRPASDRVEDVDDAPGTSSRHQGSRPEARDDHPRGDMNPEGNSDADPN